MRERGEGRVSDEIERERTTRERERNSEVEREMQREIEAAGQPGSHDIVTAGRFAVSPCVGFRDKHGCELALTCSFWSRLAAPVGGASENEMGRP